MRIFFTIIDDWRGPRRDLWLEGDPDTSVEVLAAALDGDGAADHQSWWDGDRLVAPGRPIGLEVRDGVTLARRPPPAEDRAAAPAAGELRAVSGSHAGTRWRLPIGNHLVGRSDEAAVNLVQDHRVSRRHAVLAVGPEGIAVHDEGSAHGVRLDGTRVEEAALAAGSLLQVGDTVLAWSPIDDDRAVVVPDGACSPGPGR
jgi:hypothetical protein